MKGVVCVASLLALAGAGAAAERFAFRDGDRVVFVGSTLVEREQRYGYWESALTTRFTEESLTFRNLGWSGDSVRGDAQARFGTPADGAKHRRDHVLALKPTVLVVGYGTNESFDGKDGVEKFVAGLDKLLDEFAETKARVVLLGPPPQEDLGRPLPDPAAQNKNLRLYADAVRDVAKKRGATFIDNYDLFSAEAKAGPLTDNGIHPTAYGYWRTAGAVEQGLGLGLRRWRVELDAESGSWQSLGTLSANRKGLRFDLTDDRLPPPPPPRESPKDAALTNAERVLTVTKLKPGKYTLEVDGKAVVTADAAEWAKGVRLTRGPEFDQAEKLREAIIEKNRLYFHRWRPQNETYLFGFRKHEQGKNAGEIPQFDPLVEKKEKEIATLRVPVRRAYELKEAR